MKDPGTEKIFENKCQHIFFLYPKSRIELISDYPDPQFFNHPQFRIHLKWREQANWILWFTFHCVYTYEFRRLNKSPGFDSGLWVTLYNAILRIARNFLETRENIKILTHPFYHINLGWFSWEWSKKKFFFSKKKFKMADSKKAHFSKSPILKNFSRKFLRLVLGLVELIDVKGTDVTYSIWSWGCPTKAQKQTKNVFWAYVG